MKCESGFSASAFLILVFASVLPGLNPASQQKEFSPAENELFSKWERAQAHFIKGESYFARKNYARTEVELDSCLEVFPGHAGALFLIVQMDYFKGDFAEALINIRRAEAGHAATSEAADLGDFRRRRKALLDEKAEKEREADFQLDAFFSTSCKTDAQVASFESFMAELQTKITALEA